MSFKLPAGISEDDLIDLVDGRLSREREGVVLGVLRDEPALANLVKRMRVDAATAARLEPVRAPAGLADGIEARLEAAALRDLAMASSVTADTIPISSVDVRGPGLVELLMESVWPRRLAMAASLAIVAGLGVWGVLTVMQPGKPTPGPAIATNTNGTNTRVEETRPPVAVPTAPPVDLAMINSGETTEYGPVPTVSAEAAKAVAMTDARAAELARDGRLAITIHTTITQGAVKRLDALARAGGRDGWRSLAMDNIPAEYAMLLTPSWSGSPTSPMGPSPTTGASSVPGMGQKPSAATPGTAGPVVRAIYTVDVNPGEKGMSGLVRALTDALPEGAIVELRETAQRAEAPPPLDPDSVLWWNGAPSRWSRRTTVPIVVEVLE